jgi:hypothetical protein
MRLRSRPRCVRDDAHVPTTPMGVPAHRVHVRVITRCSRRFSFVIGLARVYVIRTYSTIPGLVVGSRFSHVGNE